MPRFRRLDLPCLLLLALSAACEDGDGADGAAASSGPGAAGGASASASSSAASGAAAVSSTGGGGETGGSGGSGGAPAVGGAGGGGAQPPPDLVHYLTGNAADAEVRPVGPMLLLMGGGTDVDAAFDAFMTTVAGGDVVVLRTRGADGYNDYLHSDIGGNDSVETLLVTSTALANDPYVVSRLQQAEGIFLAGGDQATYLLAWKGTAVEDELQAAFARGAAIGGTSAGCAVLGDFDFAAYNDTVYSDEALADPYNQYMTMEYDFLHLPPLAGVVTDSHFFQRDRMGRLLAFVARPIADGEASAALGLGIDEETALLVDATGLGTVVGSGAIYAVQSAGVPAQCVAGATLEYDGLSVRKLIAGDTLALPAGTSDVVATPIAASGGVTVPAAPY